MIEGKTPINQSQFLKQERTLDFEVKTVFGTLNMHQQRHWQKEMIMREK